MLFINFVLIIDNSSAVPIFGAVAGVAGRFYLTYQEAGLNMENFKELKESVDYGMQQLQVGGALVQDLYLPDDHIIMVSLKKLASSIYSAATHIKKFTRKYESTLMARSGNTDLDRDEILDCQRVISRAIDDFRLDVTTCAASLTLRNERMGMLKELLAPPGFDTQMWAHEDNFKAQPDAFKNVITQITDWIKRTRVSPPTAQGAPLLFIEGEKGTGKSAMTTKLVRTLQITDIPLMFFFCKHSDAQRGSAFVLLKSIAYEVAMLVPEMMDNILDVGQKTRNETDITELLNDLLLEPFAAKGIKDPQRKLLVIIDAIEHIGADEEKQNLFAGLLAKKVKLLPSWVQVKTLLFFNLLYFSYIS